jgi:Peptidase family M23
MSYKIIKLLLATSSIVLIGVVFGCSAANKSQSVVNTSQATEGLPVIIPQTGAVQFKVVWPDRTRLIPVAAESLKIVMLQNIQEVASKIVTRPTTGNSVTVQIDSVPSGVLTCRVTAHPDASAIQTPQASGAIDVTIIPKQTTSSTIVLDSTIQTVSFDMVPDVVRPGQEVSVNAQAKNSTGDLVVTAMSKWEWTTSNSSIVQIVSNGSQSVLKPGATRGTARITAKETESGKSAEFTVTNLFATGEDDYPLFSKIEKARSAALGIVIDGNDSDWANIPSYDDPAGDANGVFGLDILKSSICPTEDAYLVRLNTDAIPTNDFSKACQINIDTQDAIWNTEVGLAFTFGRTDATLWISEPGQNAVSKVVTNVQIAYGNGVTEIKIPYAWLKPQLPASMQGNIPSTPTRPHVRMFVYTYQKVGNDWQVRDAGDCAASYLLKPTPYDLGDTPLLRTPTIQKATMRPPMDDLIFITQGAFGSTSHQSAWAYDIVRIDRQFYTSRPPNSTNNADHFSWEKPLIAGNSGTITYTRSNAIDLPAGGPPDNSAPANYVANQIAGGMEIWYGHCRQNSVQVSVGESVNEGKILAKVGNSGPSYGPHLHLQSQELGTTSADRTLTTSFRNVRLHIAPLLSDPWGRDLPVWDVREGYMVSYHP